MLLLRQMGPNSRNWLSFGLIFLLATAGCAVDSAFRRFNQAERLFTQGRYAASAVEFGRVLSKDPPADLAAKARYRLAEVQTLFLGKHAEAVENYKQFIQLAPDSQGAWVAQKEIGEILFSRLEDFTKSIEHDSVIVNLTKDTKERAEITFRLGRANFLLKRFGNAEKFYREAMQLDPKGEWRPRALFEVGMSQYTRETKSAAGFERALSTFRHFMAEYPGHEKAIEAEFMVGCCLEELQQIGPAISIFQKIEDRYPVPGAVKIRRLRLEGRKHSTPKEQ